MGEEMVRVRVTGNYSLSVGELLYPPPEELELDLKEALRLEGKGHVQILEDVDQGVEDEKRNAEILEAARKALDAGKVTGSGKPEVKAVEEILGYDITAEERDRAWKILEKEKGGGQNPGTE